MPLANDSAADVLFFFLEIMESGDDEEVLDAQNTQSSNASVIPSDSRNEKTNGTYAFRVWSFHLKLAFIVVCVVLCGICSHSLVLVGINSK